MEGGPRACGVAADRWWYRRGGEQRASEPSVRCVARCVWTWQEITFTVTVDRSAKELQMHASAQPGPPVRRIDFINQLTGRKSNDRAPAGHPVGGTGSAKSRSGLARSAYSTVET
jgi:hypothetical protein